MIGHENAPSLFDAVYPQSPREENETFRFSMTELRCRKPSGSKPCKELIQDPHVTTSFLSLANHMRENHILTDISISCNGHMFAAHKIVLACSSDYFMTMFNGPLACQSNVLPIFGILPETMHEILDYIYTGKITLTIENIFDILDASCLLLLTYLKTRCGKFLRERIDFDNALQVFSYAKKFSLYDLVEYALDFIALSYDDLSKTDEFKQLVSDDLIDIISLEHLSIDSEDTILESTLCWLNFDINERKNKYSRILNTVRLPYVSKPYLKEVMCFNEVIKNDEDLTLSFVKALDENTNVSTPLSLSWLSPRKCMQFIPSVISMGGPSLNIYNEELDQWCEITKCKARHCPGMDVIASDIYVVGGSLEWRRKATGEKFSTESNEWSSIADMTTARSNFGLVHRKGKLYAIGGYDGDFPLRSCEVYDPSLNKWTTVSPLHHARDGACCISDGEHVYAIGGYNGSAYLTSVERYHVENNTWDIDVIPSMSDKRQNAMSAYWDGCIYVIGGYFSSTYHTSVEMLDLEANEWSVLTPMPLARHHAGATAMNGCLFVCGGWSGQLPVQYVDVYSIKTDTWSRVASLPTPTMIRSVAVNFPKKSMLKLFREHSDIEAKGIDLRRKSINTQSSYDSYSSNASC